MNKLSKTLSSAEQQCNERGVRLTDKRKQVLAGLIQSNKALSAYELVDYCKEHFEHALPAMSVYRILDFLQTEQLVHKLDIANKFVACAHINCDHKHGVPQFLICGKCQDVKEIVIDQEVISQLEKNISGAGYTLMSQQLEMNCICNTCKAEAAWANPGI